MLVITVLIIFYSKYPKAETEINNLIHINNLELYHIFLPTSSGIHTSPISFFFFLKSNIVFCDIKFLSVKVYQHYLASENPRFFLQAKKQTYKTKSDFKRTHKIYTFRTLK